MSCLKTLLNHLYCASENRQADSSTHVSSPMVYFCRKFILFYFILDTLKVIYIPRAENTV